MMPIHSNPTIMRLDRDNNQYWATAPYNFVPLPEKVLAVNENSNQDVFSDRNGYIECKLTTESPLYVRCGMSPEFFKKNGEKSFHELGPDEKIEMGQFFHRRNSECPVLPGSTLRGMVRSLVEIVGYGKIKWVTDDYKITYRAVAASRDDPLAALYQSVIGKYGKNLKVGYLIKNGCKWLIQPAKKPLDVGLGVKDEYLKIKEKYIRNEDLPSLIKLNDDKYRPQYHEVSFDVVVKSLRRGNSINISKIGAPDKKYKYKGVLVCSGNMRETSTTTKSPRSSYELVLDADPNAKPLSISDEIIADYIQSLTPFQKEKPFSEKMGCLKEGRPIFYVSNDNSVLFFGHSPYFRVPAMFPENKRISTPKDFIPEDLRRCDMIDLAESIFGFASGENQIQGRAGRVFFTDAILEAVEDSIWLTKNPVTPRILASPKPTTFQHYLVQDKQMHHDPDVKSQLAHYATPTPSETVIRGCKIYWHKNNVKEVDFIEESFVDTNGTQHTKIRPVKSGVTFSFRIYFENLQDYELGAMLWALKLPGEKGKQYRHKLGMGKPFGLGSVKIEPTLFISDRKERYNRLFDVCSNQFCEGFSKKPDIDVQGIIKSFEDHIRIFLGTDCSSLSGIPRIQMLLKMLEWPGSNPEDTGYMNIEPINQYKERPVLPDPLNIARPQGQTLVGQGSYNSKMGNKLTKKR